MKGQIIDFSVQENSGVISGEDGARYRFTGAEWKGDRPPSRGTAVDFEAEGDSAKGVYLALAGAAPGTKSKTTAGVLALLLGGLGIHKFYLGFTGPALVYLLVNTIGLLVTWMLLFIPNTILFLMAFVEGILYLTKSDQEFEELYVVQKKKWF